MLETLYRYRWLVAFASLVVPASAFAYIDPGTGSMILQGVLAAMAGAAVTARLYWDRIRSFFFRRQAMPDVNPEETVAETEGVNEDQ